MDSLLSVTQTGQNNLGMADVGAGKSSNGSKRIIEAVDRSDDRPIWIAIWGGPNTLAQALWDVRASRTPSEVEKFVARIRVYAISDQDDSGAWIRREFKNLFYIVTPSNPASYEEYYRATWTGISGGRGDQVASGYHFDMVDNPWLETNVIQNHGPLGALYPRLQYIMEGDTPSFLGLIDRGLGWEINPAYGGWGGRYALFQPAGETRPIWTDNASTRDRVEVEKDRTETSTRPPSGAGGNISRTILQPGWIGVWRTISRRRTTILTRFSMAIVPPMSSCFRPNPALRSNCPPKALTQAMRDRT
jgi:hypothetical protein